MATLNFLSRRNGPLAHFLVGGATVGAIKLLSVPLALGLSVVLARLMRPEQYGAYAIAWTLATIGAAAISGGLSQLLTRQVAALSGTAEGRSEVRPLLAAATLILMAAGVVFGFLLIAGRAAHVTPSGLSGLLMLQIAAAATAIGLTNVSSAGLRGLDRAAEAQVFLLIVSPAASIVVLLVLLLALEPSTEVTLLALVIGYGLGAVLSRQRLTTRTAGFGQSRPARSLIPYVIGNSGGFTAYAVLMILSLQVNVLLAGYLLGPEQVSYYHLADKAAQFVALPVGILELLVASRIVGLHRQGDMDGLRRLCRVLSLAGFAAALLIAAPLFLYGEAIIGLLYGAAYAESAYAVLVILLLAQLLRSVFGPLTVVLLMTGHQRYCVMGQLLGVLALGASTLLLAPSWGVEGVAVASVVGVLAAFVPMVAGGFRSLRLRPVLF